MLQALPMLRMQLWRKWLLLLRQQKWRLLVRQRQ
jgi:hypothetical protein